MSLKTILSFLLITCSFPVFADWVNQNTGINDDLTGVVFFGDNGVVSGKKGLYYTTNGSSGNWTRFNVTGNSSDSLIYNHTQFYHCASNPTVNNYNVVFACGMDTINNKAVIFKLSLPSMSYSLVYYGSTNSKLNYIDCKPGSLYPSVFAVGDNGLMIQFSPTNDFPLEVITTGISVNFNTISCNSNNQLLVGGNGILWHGSINGSPSLFTFANTAYPSNSDVFNEFTIGLTYTYSAGSGYFQIGDFGQQDVGSYDYGSLNAETIHSNNNNYFVGTDHGIFKTVYLSPHLLELQPTTITYSINEFWAEMSATNFYACGDNGTLLLTTDNGGPSKPYAIFNFTGTCVGGNVQFPGLTGSATTCTWYLDNSSISSSSQGFYYSFPTIGDFELKLITSNGTYSDTCIRTVNIVNIPQINLPVLVADTILCKSEVLDLTVQGSELNVAYRLRKNEPFNTQYYGTSSSGNGGNLNFETLPVSQSGSYYLEALSTIATCRNSFTDMININVEHTTAKIHVARYNAEVGEEFSFYANTIDANHYDWQFPLDATVTNSSSQTVTNQFALNGHPSIGLICWSDEGCYDSIVVNPVTIYTETNPTDDNWMNRASSLEIPGNTNWIRSTVTSIKETPDGGHLTIGNYQNNVFPSQNGDSLPLTENGGYLMKYDPNGTLKWNVSVKQSLLHSPSAIRGLAVDHDGNIYINGTFNYADFDGYGVKLFDNKGDSIILNSLVTIYDKYLVKLDSDGNYLWHKSSNGIEWGDMIIDMDNKLIVTTEIVGIPYYYNGLAIDTLENMTYNDRGVLTFTPEGLLVSSFKLHSTGDYTYINSISSDENNNIYLTGSTVYNLEFYSSDQSLAYTINYNNNFRDKGYVSKYSEDGQFQWIVTTSDNQSVKPWDIITSANGTIYISGANESSQMLSSAVFNNTDGTTTSTPGGDFFVAKLSSAGVCEWIRTINSSDQATEMNMDLTNDELNILGHILNYNDSSYLVATVNNPDGEDVLLSIGYQDYFVVTYDTLGLLKHIIKNGSNLPYSGGNFDAGGIFKDVDGSIYIAMDFQASNVLETVNSNYLNFGNLVTPSYYLEQTVVKFQPNDGINITPGHHTNKLLHVCDGSDVTFEDNHTIYAVTQPMIYDAVLQTPSGIDSVITTTLTIEPYDSIFLYATLCRGNDYLFSDNVNVTNIQENQLHISQQDLGYGCLQVTQTQITVPNPEIVITLNAGILTSNVSTGTMNWVDCNNNYVPIVGATGNTFVPIENGSYALITNRGGCFDTSECFLYNLVGIEDLQMISFELYPNPTIDGSFAIHSAIQQEASIVITDLTGKVIETYENERLNNFSTTITKGVYFVSVNIGNVFVGRKKLVSL